MSLRDDMSMYYSGTFVGLLEDGSNGRVKPFYISDIRWSGSSGAPREIWDEDEDEYVSNPDYVPTPVNRETDFSAEAYENLVFIGYVVTDDSGSTSDREIVGYNNPSLVLDPPDLGYILHRTRDRQLPSERVVPKLVWLTLRPSRSVKKGLCTRRVYRTVDSSYNPNSSVNNFPINERTAWAIWNADTSGRISEDLARIDDRLEHKGVTVGEFTGGRYVIEQEASYLKRLIEDKTQQTVVIRES